jgi:heme-degrading monooxygenase HmoA
MEDKRARFRVLLRMRIRPGMEKEFEKTWYEVGSAIIEHTANRGQWLSSSAEEPGIYYIMSDWSDEPSFREFERSERHLLHRKALHPYRIDGSMSTMNIVFDMRLDGKAA